MFSNGPVARLEKQPGGGKEAIQDGCRSQEHRGSSGSPHSIKLCLVLWKHLEAEVVADRKYNLVEVLGTINFPLTHHHQGQMMDMTSKGFIS